MTDKVKLHVGYVGRTGNGKRVDVLKKSGSIYSCSDGIWRREDGTNPAGKLHSIIGPWVGLATEYPIGQWIGWNGGKCPVHPETRGDVTYACGVVCEDTALGPHDWWRPLMFRVVTPCAEPKPPREWLISMDTMHVQSVSSGFKPDGSATSYVHVREVVEADQ